MAEILSLAEALSRRQALRQAGGRLVFTNGIFDLLHPGHVAYLEQARALGEALFVGLNSDASASALKGPQRPIVSQDDRARVLAALACVEAVVVFDDPTAERLVDALRPEVYVKGGDYQMTAKRDKKRLPPEAETVRRYGGQVRIIPFLKGYSTSDLIERILARYGPAAHDL
jgi:D-glycero-beta-D-manno-heptose 1-phosphate adenylyltransferase